MATCVVAVLSTILSPPLLRMFSTEIWQALGISEVEWAVLLAVRGLFLILFIMAAGVIGDLYGRRRVLLFSLGGFLVFSLLAATASQRGEFLLVENVLPILDAFIKTLTVTLLLLAYVDEHERVHAFAAYSAFYVAGFLFSPWIAEQIGLKTGSRTAMYAISIVLTAASIVLVVKVIPESRASARVRPRNAVGLSAWVIGICAIIFAVLLAGTLGVFSPLVLGTAAVGGAILLGLLWLERRPPDDKLRVILRFERRLSLAIVAGVVLNLSLYAVAAQIYNFLRRIQQHDLVATLLRMGPVLVGALLLAPVAGRVTVRLGMRKSVALGLLLVGASAAGYALLKPETSYLFLAPLLALLGFGFIVGNAPYLLILSRSVPRELAATAQAIGRTSTQMGGALAYALMLALISTFGRQSFVRSATATGISREAAQQQVSTLAAAAGDTSLVFARPEELNLLELVSPWLASAYTDGLARAMLVLAGVCVAGAALVQFGLQRQHVD